MISLRCVYASDWSNAYLFLFYFRLKSTETSNNPHVLLTDIIRSVFPNEFRHKGETEWKYIYYFY